MTTYRRIAGYSGLAVGLIYIAAFAYFGVFFEFPSGGTEGERLRFLADHQLAISIVYSAIYIVFGALLAVLVVELNTLFRSVGPPAILTSLFGCVWIGLVIASGMIYVTGLNQVVGTIETDPAAAFDLWRTVSTVGDSIGGGNELVGGLWVLGISLLGLRGATLPRGLHYLGVVVGTSGLATMYPSELLTEVFGLSQTVWFFWLGLSLLRLKG